MPPPLNLELDLIFPIRDEPSAWVMCFKADCLLQAGVIRESQRQEVYRRAAAYHARAA